MEGTLYALSLVMLIISPVSAIFLSGLHYTRRSLLLGLALALATYLIHTNFYVVHACHKGGTTSYSLPAAVGVFIIVAFANNRKLKFVGCIMIFAVSFILSVWSISLVHKDSYVGNRNWKNPHQSNMETHLRFFKSVLAVELDSASMTNETIPSGWFEDIYRDLVGEALFKGKPNFVTSSVTNDWHSWFTGIYKVENTPVGFWCPGGTLEECQDGMIIKER